VQVVCAFTVSWRSFVNKFIGKRADWDATPFVKSWMNSKHRLATGTRVRQKSTEAFCENQLAMRNLE
jgi:hypothetical protein